MDHDFKGGAEGDTQSYTQGHLNLALQVFPRRAGPRIDATTVQHIEVAAGTSSETAEQLAAQAGSGLSVRWYGLAGPSESQERPDPLERRKVHANASTRTRAMPPQAAASDTVRVTRRLPSARFRTTLALTGCATFHCDLPPLLGPRLTL